VYKTNAVPNNKRIRLEGAGEGALNMHTPNFPPSRLTEAMMIFPCIWDVLGFNWGHDVDSPY
jgi:hypothetical protein